MASSGVGQSVFLHSQIHPVSIHSEQDEVFNYELVNLRYLEACEEYFNKPCSITGPWTRDARKHIISSIKANRIVLSLMTSVYNLEFNVLDKYQIVLDDEDEKLVLKDTSREVLPYEECFDIFVELHSKTEHGGFDMIMKMLNNTFLINDISLKIFLSKCNVCKKISLQNMKPVLFNDCVSIEILKAPIQDFECRFILFYIDSATNYILCRPLIAMDEYEISIEILKIFTDFGPPIVIKTIHAPLFNNVLTILDRGGFHYDISVHASDKVIGESYNLIQQIVARTNQDSIYWSTICRFIQYKHNNGQLPINGPILKKDVYTGIKPFGKLFLVKHSAMEYSVSKKQELEQNTNKHTSSYLDMPSASDAVVEECGLISESSGTDTASVVDEYLSQHAIEEKQYLSKDQTISNINANINMEIDEGTLYNSSIDNIDTINRNQIKVEFNPIEKASSQNSQINMSQNNEINIVANKTGIPVIVDYIPIKEEPVIAESFITRFSSDNEVLSPIPSPETNEEMLTVDSLSVETLDTDSKKQFMNVEKFHGCCSVCKGTMLTDFFCFRCKKKTHIFCMDRVTSPLKDITDTIISFTYCKVCFKLIIN